MEEEEKKVVAAEEGEEGDLFTFLTPPQRSEPGEQKSWLEQLTWAKRS